VNRELSEVVPALEWVVPFFFQNRYWGYAGDPHLANGLFEIADTVGARLMFAAITNTPHHERELSRNLVERASVLVYPRQRSLGKFINEHIRADVIDLMVTNSDALPATQVATVELGFPSMYTHHLYDRPFLCFRGFLALMDSMVNAIRSHELQEQSAKWRRDCSRSE